MISIRPILLLAAALLFSGCKRGDEMKMPPRPPAVVTVAAAVARDVPVYIDEIGRTVAVDTVAIIPQVGGKIITAHVQDGAYVKKGDPLFEIDPRPFQNALATAQSLLAQNKAELDLAAGQYARMKELAPSGAVSQWDYEQRRSDFAVAEAKISAAEAAIAQAKLNLEWAQIRSPIDGRAGALLVDPGNVVKANDVPLLVIQRLDPIYAEFTVTENELGTVRKFIAASGLVYGDAPERGLKALVDIPGDAPQVLSALGSPAPATQPATQPPIGRAGPRQGPLTFLDNAVQGSSGTVKVRATLANADHYFWPGQFVNVRVVLTTRKGAVLVPAVAQQIGQQGPYVFVVQEGEVENPDKTKEKATIADIRPITPGQRQGELIVIEKGLQAGENVVVSGQMLIMPGGKVQVSNQPAPAPPPSAQGPATSAVSSR